jgi:ribose 1,5-bisphosphokinase
VSMGERLLYVIGPSGAGKDSVLAWVRDRMNPGATVHWARRTITRALRDGDEQHEPLAHEAFEPLVAQGAFAMHWQAHGMGYGLRHEELFPLQQAHWVVVNGSRAYLHEARARYPALTAVHITAQAGTLHRRLQGRQRETPEAIQARLRRSIELPMAVDARALVVYNDGALEHAGAQLVESLQRRCGWPAQWFQAARCGVGR